MTTQTYIISATIFTSFVAAMTAASAAGGSVPVVQKVHAADGGSNDLFGSDVAMAADVAVIAAPNKNGGTAYVFRRTGSGTWVQEQELNTSNSASGVGMTVDIDADVIVIGKPSPILGYISQVFVFRRNTLGYWQNEAVLWGAPNFGSAVAIQGGYLFIAGPPEGLLPGLSAPVHVYTHASGSWSLFQKLYVSPQPASAPNQLGGSIAADGNLLATQSFSWLSGFSVRAFHGLGQEADLTPNEPAAVPQFGVRIAADGDRILVGAPDSISIPPANQSAAYLFERGLNGTWSQIAKLTPPPAEPSYLFGCDVALDGDRALVGSRDARVFYFEGQSSGAWTLAGIGTQFAGENPADFGEFVALDAGVALIGANTDGDLGSSAGAAYFFDFNPPPFAQHGTGCPGSGGVVPQLSMTGAPTAGGQLQVSITDGVGSGSTLLAIGLGAGSISMGYNCLLNIAPVPLIMLGPFPLFPLGSQGPGTGSISFGAILPPSIPTITIAAQAFVVDAGVAHGFSNTNAVVFSIQ